VEETGIKKLALAIVSLLVWSKSTFKPLNLEQVASTVSILVSSFIK
jgi:hypothetical protein